MTTHVLSAYSNATQTFDVIKEIAEQVKLATAGRPLIGGLIYSTIDHKPGDLAKGFADAFPDIPLVGASSCLAVATDRAPVQVGAAGVGGLFFVGEGPRLSAASVAKGRNNLFDVGAQLAKKALDNGGFNRSEPTFGIVHPTPGGEEELLEGISSALDSHVHVLGGTAADNDVAGRWFVWAGREYHEDGAALALLKWPFRYGMSFRSAYTPTAKKAVATQTHGRLLLKLDGKPAAEVYNEWIDGGITEELERGGNILAKSTLTPLGVRREEASGISSYLLRHPNEIIAKDKAMSLFAPIRTGEEVTLMSASKTGLISRVASTAKDAMIRSHLNKDQLSAGLMIYCGGCMFAIQDSINEMVEEFKNAIGDIPFVVAFTFGEQGMLKQQNCEHGNLMTNVLLLSEDG